MAACLGLFSGLADSDVKCEQCPDGTFSNTVSYTDPCRPHTKWLKDSRIYIQLFWELRSLTSLSLFLCLSSCHGRVVVRRGDATADTVCQPEAIISTIESLTSTKEPHAEIGFIKASAMMITDSKDPRGPTDSTLSFSLSVSEAAFNHSTKSPPPNTAPDSKLGTRTDFFAFRSSHYEKTVKSVSQRVSLSAPALCRCVFLSVSCGHRLRHWSANSFHHHHSAVLLENNLEER